MSADEVITQAAQLITGGDYGGAMGVFEQYIESNPDDPAGYHGWAEAALFDIQENGNLDDKGNDRINEGQINAYFRRAANMAPDNADYNAAYANALVEFDRIPMAVRQLHKLLKSVKLQMIADVSFHLRGCSWFNRCN